MSVAGQHGYGHGMDWIIYALLGALVAAAALYFIVYAAVIAALRQYRREGDAAPSASPDAR